DRQAGRRSPARGRGAVGLPEVRWQSEPEPCARRAPMKRHRPRPDPQRKGFSGRSLPRHRHAIGYAFGVMASFTIPMIGMAGPLPALSCLALGPQLTLLIWVMAGVAAVSLTTIVLRCLRHATAGTPMGDRANAEHSHAAVLQADSGARARALYVSSMH